MAMWTEHSSTVPTEQTPAMRSQRARTELRAAIRAVDRTLRQAGLPPRCMGFTLEMFPDRANPVLGQIADYLESWDGTRGLILTGGYGVGKTGLLAAALRALVTDHPSLWDVPLHFALAADLLDLLRQGYEAGDAAQRLARVRSARLLALDDLGAEKPTEWVQERLLMIANHRYERLLPTWITTNYGLNGLAERIGERTVWRLAETCAVIEITGRNLRMHGTP